MSAEETKHDMPPGWSRPEKTWDIVLGGYDWVVENRLCATGRTEEQAAEKAWILAFGATREEHKAMQSAVALVREMTTATRDEWPHLCESAEAIIAALGENDDA